MHRTRVDERHQAQLADSGQTPQKRQVEQGPHPRRERYGDVGRDAQAVATRVEGTEFGKRIAGHVRSEGSRPASGAWP